MEPLSVSEVSRLVKGTLTSCPELTDIAVRGEVSGYTARGHHYFTLKDETSVLKCAIWKSNAGSIDCLPLKDGDRVVAWGSVTSWGGNSSYQLDVKRCAPEGRGDLYRQYLELKRLLLAQGLFDPKHKKPVPGFPERVGIVTSEKGAALQDMVRVFMAGPGVDLVTVDARVQGEGAAESVIAGMRALDGRVDVIIIGRGGGSIEDLWAFNDEGLARAVFACGTPVISAVGHEIDEVITDHVADARASTPTAAAELIVKGMQSMIDEKSGLLDRISLAARDRLRDARQGLDSCDVRVWSRLLASRLGVARADLGRLRSDSAHFLAGKAAGARASLSEAESGLRTTWVAAMAENGLAALYQKGLRVRNAAGLRKGEFKAVMRDGSIAGEVKEIEV